LVLSGTEVPLRQENPGHPRAQGANLRQKLFWVQAITAEGLFEAGDGLSIDAAAVLRGAFFETLAQLLGNILDR
jgi:hypothetical protein